MRAVSLQNKFFLIISTLLFLSLFMSSCGGILDLSKRRFKDKYYIKVSQTTKEIQKSNHDLVYFQKVTNDTLSNQIDRYKESFQNSHSNIYSCQKETLLATTSNEMFYPLITNKNTNIYIERTKDLKGSFDPDKKTKQSEKEVLKESNKSFWAGLISMFPLIFISLIPAALAIIWGVKALNKLSKNKEKYRGKGKAIIGIVIGIIILGLYGYVSVVALQFWF